MALRDELERQGGWLFRHRSFVPLVILPLFAFAGLQLEFIAGSHRVTEMWAVVCLMVTLLGLGVRIATVGRALAGTSGRNTREQVADSLSTTGMYSVVRNPLYLGNFLIWLGITMLLHSWWLTLCMTALYALFYERIICAEEAFLRQKFGADFERWAAPTPTIIPRFSGWKASAYPFEWRTVLRREYPGFFAITIAFALLTAVGDSLAAGELRVDPAWVVLLVFGAVVFVTLRTLKRHTKVLHVEGRQ